MKYNVWDLYSGNVKGDRLKEVALKLNYAKASKSEPGMNGSSREIDESQLLSGLHPSVLSLIQFEVKFKTRDSVPISELFQDIHFKNAIYNVAINVARLQVLMNELKSLYYKEQEILKAIDDIKLLIEKEKQAEKFSAQNEQIRLQIEQQNRDLQNLINDYIKQRAEKIKALEETIKELNIKERELIAYDKQILAEHSAHYATNLDKVQNKQGKAIFSDLSEEQKKTYAEGVFDDVFKINRKYEKRNDEISERLVEIDKEIKEDNNNNLSKTSTFNSTAGTINTAFRLHSERTNTSSPKKVELEKEKAALLVEQSEIPQKRDAEISQAIIDNARNVGKELSKEDVEVAKDHLLKDKNFVEMSEKRDVVHDEIEVVHEAAISAKNDIQSIQQELINLPFKSDITLNSNLSTIENLTHEKDKFENLLNNIEDDTLDLTVDTDDLDLNFDMDTLEQELDDTLEVSSKFLDRKHEELSASMRTKLS